MKPINLKLHPLLLIKNSPWQVEKRKLLFFGSLLQICWPHLSIRYPPVVGQIHVPGDLPYGGAMPWQTQTTNKTTNTQQMSARNATSSTREVSEQAGAETLSVSRSRRWKAFATYGELVQLSFNWRLLNMSMSVCQNPESISLLPRVPSGDIKKLT